MMKFGLQLSGLSPRHYPEVARAAEGAGFESVWVAEHLVFPAELPATYLYTPDGRAPITPATATYDPWVLLAMVAATTSTIRLATNVYILPLRHPLVTARSVLTLDRVSHGRVTMGVGVGWLKDEFDIVGESFRTRGRRADEIIPLLRRLWSEEVVEHHGTHYDLPPVRFEPKPFQKGGIPIEVGGTSPAALRRAGALGDGWIAIGTDDPEELTGMIHTVLETRKESGRDGPFDISTALGDDRDDVPRYADLGITRLLTAPGTPTGRLTLQNALDFVSRFGDEVIHR